MNDIDSLVNRGFLTINQPATSPEEKTAVVIGVARGGTTMVASVLQALGVYMGENLGPVLEDVRLSEAVEAGDSKAVNVIAAERDKQFRVWGWKRPAAVQHAAVWQPRLRNPHVIAVYRDPFAIANRNRISMLMDCIQGIERATKELARLTQFIKKSGLPTLVCSYEKAMIHPHDFVRGVDAFLGLGAEEKWDSAVAAIGTDERYLHSSRITAARGYVDIVDRNVCSGWAFYTQRPGRQAKVRLYVSGRYVGECTANGARPDVRDAGFHDTGACGFSFHWPAGQAPQEGDVVEVWVEGEVKPLPGTNIVAS
ncbi:hypothetical protein [Arhodomonas sp. AD133]|uniref:hypothetical protein n=1 Tax=Arhodomonas sp. AD133 TaxID=3415009 RepID=UPI003EB934CC